MKAGRCLYFRRIPKRGFNNNRFKTKYTILNIKDFESFDSGTRVDLQKLKDSGLIKNTKYDLKILGEGVLTKSLTIAAQQI